jgi:hypothetical protein
MGWAQVAGDQHGVISRRQALDCGMTPAAIDHRVRSQRWRRVLPGVYLTFTGPVPATCHAWAAVFYAGTGAVLGPRETMAVAGLMPWPVGRWSVLVPASRRVSDQDWLRVRTAKRLDSWRQAASAPLRLEVAVLLFAEQSDDPQGVVNIVLAATADRRTTPTRLAAELGRWPRARWRVLLGELLEDVVDGVQSPLERRWRRDVELRHRVPHGHRQAMLNTPAGAIYRDVTYDAFQVVVELDGQLAHPAGRRFRDRGRDNLAARRGETALRYGWHEVAADPCGCAAELVA